MTIRGLGYLSSLSGTVLSLVLAPGIQTVTSRHCSPLLTLRGLQETDHHNWYFHDRSSVVPRPEVWLPLRVLCCSGRRQYSTNYGPDRLTCLPSLRRVPGGLSLYNQQLDYNLLSPSLLLILLLLLDIVIVSRNLITIRTFLFSEMSNIF